MRFSKGVSFNTHDSKVTKGENGRIQVDRTERGGVLTRCDISLRALILWGPKGADSSTISEYLNKKFKANYTSNDVRHALDKLSDAGVIKAKRYGRGESTIYVATKSSQNSLRRLTKV